MNTFIPINKKVTTYTLQDELQQKQIDNSSGLTVIQET